MPRRTRKVSRKQRRKRGNSRRQCGGNPLSLPQSPDFGFIMTRCVKKPEHNRLYKEAYRKLREFHPTTPLVVIDDNSDPASLEEIPMENTTIIKSEFPGAGEYLPYYYMLKRRLFKKAVTLQDSMFVNTTFDPSRIQDYRFLYYFKVDRYDEGIIRGVFTQIPRGAELLALYESPNWNGDWGSTMGITLEFLDRLEKEFRISEWHRHIQNRASRCALERIVALCCQLLVPKPAEDISFFGFYGDMEVMRDKSLADVHSYNIYEQDKERVKDSMIKIWNGR